MNTNRRRHESRRAPILLFMPYIELSRLRRMTGIARSVPSLFFTDSLAPDFSFERIPDKCRARRFASPTQLVDEPEQPLVDGHLNGLHVEKRVDRYPHSNPHRGPVHRRLDDQRITGARSAPDRKRSSRWQVVGGSKRLNYQDWPGKRISTNGLNIRCARHVGNKRETSGSVKDEEEELSACSNGSPGSNRNGAYVIEYSENRSGCGRLIPPKPTARSIELA